MRRTFICSLFAILLCSTTPSMADTLASTADARHFTDQIMNKVGRGDTETALQQLEPYLVISSEELESVIAQMKVQQPTMLQRFGRSIGSEFIQEDKVGANLYRLIYMQRFEQHAMRWSFIYYRGSNGWVLDTFKTKDEIGEFFNH